ncbi:hypothetical protein ACKWTF_008058 [Chironomus riparius]
MTSSSVIYKLLTKSTEQRLNVQIPQISKPIMLEICRYAYTDEVKHTTENMLEVFFAASKFEMKILIKKTVDFICKQISYQTVFKILESNQAHNNLRINMKCFEYIEKHYHLCLENPDFLSISEELFRTILTTCKISPRSAIPAIKKWTNENDEDVLDELMGIVDLSDESDQEEASNFEPIKPISSSTTLQRPISSGMLTTPIPRSSLTNLINEKENSKVFKLLGNTAESAYKYANLDIFVGSQNIFLHSLKFIYDLKTTDKEFEISVIEVDDNRRTTLYNDKVIFSSRSKGPFTSFDFMQKIELQADKKIWFKIEYPRHESRKTYDHFDVSPVSSQCKDITLRKDYAFHSYTQIINAIFYTSS